MAGVGSWFGAFGMQSVLFSWLIVGELESRPEWVGVAQTVSTLPQLALLLVGGLVADRLEPRRMLVVLHLFAALPALLLAITVSSGLLCFPAVVGYGMAMGLAAAFMMPARDSLLSRVVGGEMIRAVTMMTMVQFACQGAGTLLAGSAAWLGSVPVLCVQAGALALGALFASRLPAQSRAMAHVPAPSEGRLRDVTAGIREVFGSPLLRTTVVLVIAVGFFFIGPFLVIFPLLVRDVYNGGVDQLSVVLMLFPAGTILGSIALRAWGALHDKVRATMLALITGALFLAAIGQGVSFPWFLVLTLGWGLAGAVFINASRTLFQEEASPAHRARVLSVYQLGLMGAAPLGSLSAGFASGVVGPLQALVLFAGAMLVLVAGVWWRTPRVPARS